MNFRHAAALAAVGWYLMVPPFGNGDFKENAPISQWSTDTSFDTAKECEDYRVAVNKKTQADLPPHGSKPTDSAQAFAVKMLLGQCIASDDPRLKGK
ncbi:MAG: hypothetical protein ABSD31_21115 [Candidatus Binataceae bacterium]|jgi:hypothetical protein